MTVVATRTSISPRANDVDPASSELRHDTVFLTAVKATVEGGDAQAREGRVGAQLVGHGIHAGERAFGGVRVFVAVGVVCHGVHPVRVLALRGGTTLLGRGANLGANDIDLVSLSDFFGNALPRAGDPRGLRRLDDVGDDGRPAGRKLAQGEGFHVAKNGHGNRSWDWCRRHHEHVRRVLALLSQRISLLDSKAMLLIDDDQPQVKELDMRLDERMRADDDASRAGGNRRQRRASLAC